MCNRQVISSLPDLHKGFACREGAQKVGNISTWESFLPRRLPAVFLPLLVGYLVTVMLRRTAIRSASGGCVLNRPVNTCPALNGATMNREAVAGETSIGILLLYAPSF